MRIGTDVALLAIVRDVAAQALYDGFRAVVNHDEIRVSQNVLTPERFACLVDTRQGEAGLEVSVSEYTTSFGLTVFVARLGSWHPCVRRYYNRPKRVVEAAIPEAVSDDPADLIRD